MLSQDRMRVLPNTRPSPRLLTTVVPEHRPAPETPDSIGPSFRLRGASIFGGNGLAIFIGSLVGVAGITALAFTFRSQNQMKPPRPLQLITRTLHTFSASREAIVPPAPISVRITRDMVQVTAIALGHPRLAVINGHQVAEGDSFTIHVDPASVVVRLRVLKIEDGRIDVTDGKQTISLGLSKPGAAVK